MEFVKKVWAVFHVWLLIIITCTIPIGIIMLILLILGKDISSYIWLIKWMGIIMLIGLPVNLCRELLSDKVKRITIIVAAIALVGIIGNYYNDKSIEDAKDSFSGYPYGYSDLNFDRAGYPIRLIPFDKIDPAIYQQTLEFAERGNVFAQRDMAIMIFIFGKHNCADGIKWLKAAAEQGYEEAQFELGRILSRDTWAMIHESQPDYVQAYKWLILARFYESDEGEKCKKCRRELAKKMTPTEIAEAKKSALEWKPKRINPLKKGW